jgi:hypothetical protein
LSAASVTSVWSLFWGVVVMVLAMLDVDGGAVAQRGCRFGGPGAPLL